jgi:hypothetical protein
VSPNQRKIENEKKLKNKYSNNKIYDHAKHLD